MGGTRKFKEEIHGNFVAEQFQLYDEGDEENGWDVTEVPVKGIPTVRGGNNKVYEWWDIVSAGVRAPDGIPARDGIIEWANIGMKKKTFLNNVKICAANYLAGPNGKRYHANVDGPNGERQDADVSNKREPTGIRSGTVVESVEGTIVVEDEHGNKMTLFYTQCIYLLKQRNRPSKWKIFINAHGASGWFLSQEKYKRNFARVVKGGNVYRLSLTGNECLYDGKNGARNVLARFGSIYASTKGVEHNAVAAMGEAIKAKMPMGKVPSFDFDIPLLKKCRAISSIEGLTRKSNGRMIPDTKQVPAVSDMFSYLLCICIICVLLTLANAFMKHRRCISSRRGRHLSQ